MSCSVKLNRQPCTKETGVHLINLRVYRESTGTPYDITVQEPSLKEAIDSAVHVMAELGLIKHPSAGTLLDLFQLRNIKELPRTIRIGGYNPIDLIYLHL